MGRRWRHKWVFLAIALGLFVAPGAFLFVAKEASGSNLLMQALPSYEKYRCALCHTTSTPVIGGSDLNTFGSDFVANGGVWDMALAQKNSDGDRCSNGFELGDRNGDGIFDNPGGDLLENSNPGDPNDCTVPVDARTWGIIKDMFRSEIQEFEDNADLGDQFLLYYP